MTYDIVIWGASSFVGKLVAEYLTANYSDTHNIALAGRSGSKLNDVNKDYCEDRWPILVGDANDELFLNEMVGQAKLVISTVGPYALYGESLIKSCVEAGIDYCDLTGEPQWIWQMLQNYEQQAQQTGARILHCCGFDSIPSDMGVYQLQKLATEQTGQPCHQIHYRFKASKGGFSGGTVASMLNAIKQISEDKAKARLLKTPYALISKKPKNMPYQHAVKRFSKDAQTGHYLAPFIMASINTKVVHRTNYLLGYPWKTDFLYDEAMQFEPNISGRLQALKLVLGLGLFGLFASFPFTRRILEKYIVPKPGEGPSQDVVKQGFFEVELIGKYNDHKEISLTVSGKGDPGYGSTCQMISETANLLLSSSREKTGVGFLTPAAALGSDLIDKLEQNAQVTFAQKLK